ncbi:hypothetical protein ABZW11_22855 [Nonomuraea sp. NPDC004580]|uniref:DUF6941 family protein n=1 Tax=Nonomuraea sp. NPDC004580 TaxID=3154552 RepID=UPI0033A52B66
MIEGFLVLADSATTDATSGKVHMLGAGWSLTGPAIPPSAVTGFLRLPWEEAGEGMRFRLRLVGKDQAEVKVLHEDGECRAVAFEGTLGLPDVQSTDELTKQVPMNLCFAIPVPPLPLPAGHVYEWIFDVEGLKVASVRFAVRGGS